VHDTPGPPSFKRARERIAQAVEELSRLSDVEDVKMRPLVESAAMKVDDALEDLDLIEAARRRERLGRAQMALELPTGT